MKVYLIRHGESLHNATNDIRILDPHLTSTGINQSTLCPLSQLPVNMILSSSASRGIQTAKNMFGDSGLTIYATDLLLEYNTGVPCNRRKEMPVQIAEYPDVNFTTYQIDPLTIEVNWQDGVIRSNRILTLLRNIKDTMPHVQTIAVVSHQNIIKNIIYELTQKYVDLAHCEHYSFDL